MADFVAVLRKTLDGLSEATPPMREKVYDKARSTISAKLAAMVPPPPGAVVERQKRALEDAIASIELDYSGPAKAAPESAGDPLAELENVFAAMKNPAPRPTVMAPLPKPADAWLKQPPAEALPALPVSPPAAQEPVDEIVDEQPDSQEESESDHIAPDPTPERKRNYGGLIAAAIVLAVIAGGGYGVWLNKDAFGEMIGLNAPTAATTTPVTPQPAPASAPEPEPETDVAAAPPLEQPAPSAPEPAIEPAASTTKFTQRLTSDGAEVDPGPAGGEPAIGEGTTVAAATQLPTAAAPAEPADPVAPAGAAAPAPAAAGAAPAAPAAAAQPALAVGQKAIFYEERTNVAEGSAEPGSVVWSVVQESPGGDMPPEPAIRAEATIPGKDVQLRMTIRRNADQTLPASHIIEVIFLTPEGFDGGGIDNVLRISMKGSEQEAGSPLLGIPAKIADGFFLVALNQSQPEIDANLTLLRRQNWIDVPVVYKSGRRALFTMEKGIPGAKAFDEAIKAWQAATAG